METIILWAALSLVAAALVAILARDLRFAIDRRHRTEAVVISHERLHEDGSVVHAAVLSFTDHSGQEHRVVDALLTTTRRPPIGARLPVVFPERRPGLARIPRPMLRATIYLVTGLLLVVVAARIAGWIA